MTSWTSFHPLPNLPSFTPSILAETLNGGQAFRWKHNPDINTYQGIWGNHIARIQQSDNGTLLASAPTNRPDTLSNIETYLGADLNWPAIVDSLPWRSDPHLATCLDSFKGLRLLQQPFPETLLAFLCSATKQIPQIKVMCENLANALGTEIIPGHHALPTWGQLAAADEQTLRSLALGFRAKNIKKTADFLASNPNRLAEIEAAPYEDAKRLLLELHGVGEKIADCALLFGAQKLQAFPVDTWIIKVLEKRYNLQGWSNPQLSQFGRIHFGEYAGFAQQFLFSWERANRPA